MKLSMWMIANRISSLDLECNIRETAAPILNSARLVYATNCVRIYQDGSDVICDGEGDSIRIRDIQVSQAFEIIQSVFDYFEDWSHQISLAIMQNAYQDALHLAWQVFHNPLVLFDANNKVLAMTDEYPEESMDPEWHYLKKYGYASLNAIQSMRYPDSSISLSTQSGKVFRFPGNKQMKYGGIYYNLIFNDIYCGHLNLLAVDHELNQGDLQLLEYIARFLEPTLGKLSGAPSADNTSNVFLNVLLGKPYDQRQLDMMLYYQKWTAEDSFWLALVALDPKNKSFGLQQDRNVIHNMLVQQLDHCILLKHQEYILILSNQDLTAAGGNRTFLENLANRNPIQIGFSYPCKGLTKADYLYSQAEAALIYGKRNAPDQSVHFFFDYAYDYILECPHFYDRVRACLPGVIQLFEMSQHAKDPFLETLIQYLNCDRSISKTSAALFTHRNTIQYRIAKIEEILQHSLDDAYTRDYCRLSIRILQLYQKADVNELALPSFELASEA